MPASKEGGYLNLRIHHLNGRLFNRLLTNDGRALYNGEQGKIISALWMQRPQSATELAKATGLANSSLTPMLKRLEEQGLLYGTVDEADKRRKLFDLTELGAAQEEIGNEISDKLSQIFYQGFTEEEIAQYETLSRRILDNLGEALENTPKAPGNRP